MLGSSHVEQMYSDFGLDWRKALAGRGAGGVDDAIAGAGVGMVWGEEWCGGRIRGGFGSGCNRVDSLYRCKNYVGRSCTPTDGLFLIWQHRRIHWAGISHVRQATAVKVLLGPSHEEVGKAGWLVNNASWLKIEKKNLDWIVEYTVVLSVSARQKMTEGCCKSHLFNSICFWHFLVWPSKLTGSTEAECKTIKDFTVSKDFFFQSCFPSTKFSVAFIGQKQYSRVLCWNPPLCFFITVKCRIVLSGYS